MTETLQKPETIIFPCKDNMFEQLKQMSAKTRYYFEQHKRRWEYRYGRKYPEGETGRIGGINWIKT